MRAELPTTKPTCLLLYLACRGDWVGRDELAESFRPEADEATARHTLRLLLSRAKRFSRAVDLEIEPRRLRWTPQSDPGAVFGRRSGVADWAAAVRLYRGPLLEGFTVRDTPGFEDFVELERRALESAWREAALRHAHDLEDAEPQRAATLLAHVLARDLLAEGRGAKLHAPKLPSGWDARTHSKCFAAFREHLDKGPRLGAPGRNRSPGGAHPPRRQSRGSSHQARCQKCAARGAAAAAGGGGVDAVRAALVGSPSPVVLLAGEPGVGKTRLLREVAPEAVWLRGPRRFERTCPTFPLQAWLRDTVGALPTLAQVYLDELARLVPELAPGRLPPPFDPLLGRSRLLEAFAQLFGKLVGGATLVFDDLQWADAASLELLLYLAERPGFRILGDYRSTEAGAALQGVLEGLKSNGRLELLELLPLTAADVTDLVASLSGQPQGPPLFGRWLHARTGGNPFFILETLKALFENGIVREQDQQWHTDLDDLTRDYGELEVPQRVAETVRRRIASLSEATKRVLGVAAVVREDFTPDLLSALTGLSSWAVLDVLEEAERGGLLRGTDFGHDLVRQSLYESTGSARRKALHVRTAALLETTANPAVVAEHYFLGGDVARAAVWWLTAARRFNARDLPDLAATLLEDKLSLVLSPWSERLQAELAETYLVLGRYEWARQAAQAAQRAPADAQARGYAYLVEAHLAFTAGNLEEMEPLLTKAQEFGSGQDEAFRKKLAETWCVLLHARGRFQDALTLIEPYLNRDLGETRHLNMVMNAATLLDCLERHQEALALHEQAWSLVADTGSCYYRVNAASNLLACYIDLQRPEAGVEVAETALAACSEYPHIATLTLRNNLGAAYRRLGRFGEAVTLYEAVTQGELTTSVQLVALSSLARLYHQLGDKAASHGALERALNALATIQLPAAKGRVYMVTLAVGTDAQKARIREEVVALDLTILPPDVREELSSLLDG